MHWLIVEDALRDRKGHWFEYISTFDRELRALGDQVTVLADRSAESFLVEQLHVQRVLPESIWHRMGDGAGALRRILRIPLHAWETYRAVRPFLANPGNYDIVFVPTVLVHHLLAWVWLIKLHQLESRILLFFPNLPIGLSADGSPLWSTSPNSRLLRWLLVRLRPELETGRVILGVETHRMREAMSTLTRLPVIYLPHPVASGVSGDALDVEETQSGERVADVGSREAREEGRIAEARSRIPTVSASTAKRRSSTQITMACYGPARAEKGSDILIRAITIFLQRFPESRVRFVFQWMEDFFSEGGDWVRLDTSMLNDKRVEVIQRYFNDGEYADYLARTNVLLLPYRRSSYGLRVSRVVIEAMTAGIPVITTRETTLHEQSSQYGSCLSVEDGNVESLVQGIQEVELHYEELREAARSRQVAAQEHFSVGRFRNTLDVSAK